MELGRATKPTIMMENLSKERYEPPKVEVLLVAVERGFAASGANAELPEWEQEEGYWQ